MVVVVVVVVVVVEARKKKVPKKANVIKKIVHCPRKEIKCSNLITVR